MDHQERHRKNTGRTSTSHHRPWQSNTSPWVYRWKHQQKILRLNKGIDDLIANRHVARRGCFDNVLCFIKKNSEEVHSYYVIRCQYRQLEKHKQWLKLRYPKMEVIDKCDGPNAIHLWNRFKREVIKKPDYYKNHVTSTWQKTSGNFLKLPWMSLFKSKEFCSLYHRQQNIMIKKYILNKHECLRRIRSHDRT